MKEFDIVTCGSAIMDSFITTKRPVKHHLFSYLVGSKFLITNLKTDIGGGATNAAVAFSRLGFKTGCICSVGNDAQGTEIISLLDSEKITFLGKKKKEKTGQSVILHDNKNGRSILTYKGASDLLQTSDIPLFKTKWLYLSSLLEFGFKTQKNLVKRLKKNNTKIAFNPSEYLIKAVDIKPILQYTNVLIINKEEAKLLVKKYKKKGRTVDALRRLGPSIVVVTNAHKKITAYNGITEYAIIPHNIKVVERTGAGDAFAAGFVAGMMANYSLQDALKLGLEEGESVLKYFGAKNKLLKRKLK